MPQRSEVDRLAVALAALAVTALWRWALQGARALHRSPAGPTYRARALASSGALALCLALVVVAGLTAAPAFAIGGAAASICVLAAALDPARSGFWHHRRLRPLGVAGLALAGLGLAFVLPRTELVPLAAAAWVFHRHQRANAALAAEAWREAEELRERNASLTAELRLREVAATTPQHEAPLKMSA